VNQTGGTLLRVQNLEVSYGAVQVLWGVSLSVVRGQVAAIIGSNGAGKSTTLNAISGVLKATSGRIVFKNEDLASLPPRERVRRHISLVPEGRQLWPKMTVEENLMMGAFPPKMRKNVKANIARVYEMFPRLKERRSQLAGTLSGGEQQMCAIGRALMARPRVLMLDEPTLGLAPVLVARIFETVRTINADGMTVLLVEQNVRQALTLAHRAAVLESGHLVLDGRGTELLGDERLKRAYLGL